MVASRHKHPSGYDVGILHRGGLFVLLFSLQTARLWPRAFFRPFDPYWSPHFSEGADRGFDSLSDDCLFSFFKISLGKRGVYLLPLSPTIPLIFGAWWNQLEEGQVQSRGLARAI